MIQEDGKSGANALVYFHEQKRRHKQIAGAGRHRSRDGCDCALSVRLARDTAQSASDLDLFIDYNQESRFNAFDLIGIKLLLETTLSIPVDITTRDGLHPALKSGIENSAIRVF